MRRTIIVKLNTDAATDAMLLETLRQYTACVNSVCEHGWKYNQRNGINLHHATYHTLRDTYPELPSQLVVSARMRATESLKAVYTFRKQGRKVKCPQSQLCSVRYDARSYSMNLETGLVSLATTGGRIKKIKFRLADYYRPYLTWQVCTADLFYNDHKKRFYLHICVESDAPDITPNGNVVGCDMGVKRVAVTSTPQFFSSARLHTRFRQLEHIRAALQAKGTKSAKKHLRKNARRRSLFQASHNHLIANAILARMAIGDTLALENLTGIGIRCKHHKNTRGLFHSWSFAQLGMFLSYKAERKGIKVVCVDPRNTSRTCSKCGYCAKANRTTQSFFCCKSCGYSANADFNAAQNIRQRGITFLSRLLSDSQSLPTAISSPIAQARCEGHLRRQQSGNTVSDKPSSYHEDI